MDDDLADLLAKWKTLPDDEKFARLRTGRIARCLRLRKIIQAEGSTPGVMLILRREQKMLLQLRIWRATGVYPSLDN